MKKLLLVLCFTASFAPPPLSAQGKPAATEEGEVSMPEGLTADQIVDAVKRSRCALQPLNGILTKGGKEVPFVLKMTESLIHISFENPKQNINLDIGDKTFRLKEVTAGSNKEVPAAQYSAGVRGTDLTYDDLSMRYLYWPKKVTVGEETIKTQKCYVVDLYNPQRLGDYYLVRIFVGKNSGAIMRMNCFDWNGKIIKSCSVTAGMKIPDPQGKMVTVLKTMEVIRYVPGTKKVAGETTFELRKPQK